MPKVECFKCDHCGKLISDDREVYHVRMEGREWREGPPASDCQNVIALGFCDKCARRILTALQDIADTKK